MHICLPPLLMGQQALETHGINPTAVELRYGQVDGDPLIHSIAVQFDALMSRPRQRADGLLIDGLRTTLVARLINAYGVDCAALPTVEPELHPRILSRVVDYIDAQLKEQISLENLAATACLSPFHFSRLFKAATGMSPHRYVTDRRVRLAQERLAMRSGPSLAEIALEIGFGSQDNFTRVFRKSVGMAPGAYRRLARR